MTIGLFIMSKDYIKFLSDLEKYLNMDLVFIKIENSKYFISGELSKSTNYPIGLLEDVEIHFLHYDNEIEAKEKWDKRKKRVNLNNLIIKYNNQNGFEESDLEEFDKLSYKNKLFFTNDNNILPKYGYFIKSSGESIRASYEPIIGTKIMNLTYYLNLLK
ncbi:uncharacterized protein (DUF1919 family) [Enterococcus lemanii]|nr:uncharacterized protein (DUF1919 family) [Enterococcus lemanii]